MGSLAHLSNVGTGQYCTDWVKSRWWIKERFGSQVLVVPLPPVPVGGITGRSLIRSIIEVAHWFMASSSTEALILKGVYMSLLDSFLSEGVGVGWANERQSIRLPVSLDSPAFVSTVSEGWGNRPDEVPPLSQAAEELLISPLLCKLNEAFSLNLCLSPSFERDVESIVASISGARGDMNYLVVGGSHASRLATAMGELGCSVDRVTAGGWKVTSDNVAALLEKLDELSVVPDIMILQLLDNSSFFCLGEDGTLSLPAVHSDNKHHVTGQLKVANKDQVKAIFKLITPILRYKPDMEKILVSCLPRYTVDSCCSNSTHNTSFGTPGAAAAVSADLTSMKRLIRSLLFTEKIPNVTILDPISLFDGPTAEDYLDPVHLNAAGYEKIAARIVQGPPEEGSEVEKGKAGPPFKKARLSSRGGLFGPPTAGRGNGGPRGGRMGGRGRWRPRGGNNLSF